MGGVARDLMRRGLRVESAAKRNLGTSPRRIDTGHLRASITTQLVSGGGRLSVRVGTAVRYAVFVHEGTGIYGPRGTLIKPKSKQVLRWRARKGRGKGGYTYSRWSRGMRPNPFLRKALRAAKG